MQNDKLTGEKKSPSDQSIAHTRRRFLKGTGVAFPAVMTLHVQSVSAASGGSFFQCIENSEGEHVSGLIDSPDDGYQRKVVNLYKCDRYNHPNYGMVAFYDHHAGVCRSMPTGEQVNIYGINSEYDFDAASEWGVNNPSYCYALVRFDETSGSIISLGVTGDQASYYAAGGAGIAMSAGGACWNSIMYGA